MSTQWSQNLTLSDGNDSRPSKAQHAEGRQVLIVDDMSTTRLMLSRYVRQLGHQETTATNGREALELLQHHKFDLILLDVMMPEMDGYTVLEAMKSNPELRDIPVVMISGVDEIESVVRCIERGAEDYLPKPFNATLLRARISACLEKKRLWDELGENYRQLQELERLRDSLTDMIVHDLRTPLASFIIGLQTMDSLGDLSDLQRECLSLSLDGGQMLLSMINDLLDISRMEQGTVPIEYSPLAIESVVKTALRQVTQMADDKNIALDYRVATGRETLLADDEKLCRVLVNLLGNSIKFTPNGGSVHIEVGEDGSDVRFGVRDTGEGIPAEAFGRIFEKFGQVESRLAGRKMSTGLGLTFCKMAVEAHGGRIWVESQPGQGSTFFFTLPLHQS
ncbi:MAG TPA: hybrid sensor histidine kinase/response regulator [Abditibacteriaceae bacterium]|jgi:signal transduction histidine kinase